MNARYRWLDDPVERYDGYREFKSAGNATQRADREGERIELDGLASETSERIR